MSKKCVSLAVGGLVVGVELVLILLVFGFLAQAEEMPSSEHLRTDGSSPSVLEQYRIGQLARVQSKVYARQDMDEDAADIATHYTRRVRLYAADTRPATACMVNNSLDDGTGIQSADT